MTGTSDPAGVRGEIGAFLSTRRARISPAQAGLPVYRGEHRRGPGPRREEGAVLAGGSAGDYNPVEGGKPPRAPPPPPPPPAGRRGAASPRGGPPSPP